MNSVLRWGTFCIAAAIAVAAFASVIFYPGNRLVFSFFSFVIFAILVSAVRSNQYTHFFLGIMLFLGFWTKYIIHQATGARYVEPNGAFDGSAEMWDAAFLVIAVGGCGYLLGRLAIFLPVKLAERRLSAGPTFYPKNWSRYRNAVWTAAAVLVVVLLWVNADFGILVRGHVAKVALPWPLGGLFAWTTDIGVAILLALLLSWDRQAGFGASRGFVALCLEGALISVSTLSRGVYFFHTIPPLVTESETQLRTRGIKASLWFLAAWVAIGVAVPSASTFIRLLGSNPIPAVIETTAPGQSNVRMGRLDTGREVWNQVVRLTQILVVDRWTGLEGVMATVSYPERNLSVFKEAALQHRRYGTVDVYTGKISNSGFTTESAKKYHYASPSGPVAFLYFSNSFAFVFVGMALIAIFISAVDLLWLLLVKDKLLLAMGGFYLSFVILQLSGNIIQSTAGVVMLTCLFVGIWVLSRIASPGRETATKAQAGCTA